MKKIGLDLYNKLVVQAEEAKKQNMEELLESISRIIEAGPEVEYSQYGYSEMTQDVEKDLWTLATNVIHYHNVDSLDIEKMNEVITIFASKLIDELENAMKVQDNSFSSLEPKVPGQL